MKLKQTSVRCICRFGASRILAQMGIAICTVLATQSALATVPTPGYYWNLDYNYTNSGSIHGSTLSPNGTTRQIAGRIGSGAIEIRRAGDYVSASGVTLSTNYTVSFWVNPGSMAYGSSNSTGTVNSHIIDKSGTSTTNDQFEIVFGANSNLIAGKIQVTIWNASYTTSVTALTSRLLMNRWTHVTVTVDSVLRQLIVYLNGVPNASVSLGNIVAATSGDRIGFGNRYNGSVMNGSSQSYFSGDLDDVQIWPGTVLDAYQVLSVASAKPRPDYWWKFDNDTKDFIGYQDAIMTGDATNFIQGKIGWGAITLDGNSYAEAPAVNLGQTGNYTVSMWLFPSNYDGSSEYSLLTKEATANQFRVFIDGSQGNKLCVQIFGGSGNSVTLYSTLAIPLNNWTHLAVIVGANNTVQLYLNGIANTSAVLMFTPLSGISDALRMGAETDGTMKFTGSLDDVRVYRDKVLPPSEIALIANPPELFMQSPSATVYGRYFQTERRLYEYEPQYLPDDPVSFDSMNRPYILGPGYVQTLNNSNQWVRLDFTSFIKAKYPSWDGVAGTFVDNNGLGGDSFDGRIVFDNNDWAYTHVNTQNRTTTSPLKNFDLILYSTNYCRTWQMISVTNTYQIRWETRGLWSDHTRPPLMLGCASYVAPTRLSLYEFSKNGTSLSLSKVTVIETNSPGLYNHSGSAREIITVSNLTHVIWSRNDLTYTNMSIYIATLNRLTDLWNLGSSPSGGVNGTYLGGAGQSVDGHNVGALEVDSHGYLHVVLVGHDWWEIKYYRSTQPNETTNWTAMVHVSTNTSYINTYPSLVCDSSDNLHLMTRGSLGGYFFHVCYYVKPAGQPWSTNPLVIVQNTDDNYAVWYHKAEIDRLGNVYFSYNCNFKSLDLSAYDDYVREWPEDSLQTNPPPILPPPSRYMYSTQPERGSTMRVLPLGGTNWMLATTANFVSHLISPMLGCNATDGTNTLWWSVTAYKLQSTTNLAGVWTDYQNGDNSPVSVRMNQSQQYFRLAPK